MIVDFPQCTIPQSTVPGFPPTCVAIPICTQRCEKKCCSISAIPLRVCVALSIHKSQGMTVGENEQFRRVRMFFPGPTDRKTPGLEIVAASRAKTPNDFVLANDSSEIYKTEIRKIGATPAYAEKRRFQDMLKQRAQPSQQVTIDAITDLDPNADDKTFEGGCEFLLRWYRTLLTPADDP